MSISAKVRKEVYERSEGRCERILPDVGIRCWKPAIGGLHHKLPVARGGKDTPENLMHVCFECHRWAHDNPAAAEQEGILLKQEAK